MLSTFFQDSLINRKIQRFIYLKWKAFVTLFNMPIQFKNLELVFWGGGGGGGKKLFSNALNWSKVIIKTFIMLQKSSISDKCFFWTFYSSKKPEKVLLSCFQHNNNNNNKTSKGPVILGFFGMGMMVERLKHEGTSHSSSDLLKICEKMGVSWSAQDFRQAGVTPSGPGAFFASWGSSTCHRSCWNSSTLPSLNPSSARQ